MPTHGNAQPAVSDPAPAGASGAVMRRRVGRAACWINLEVAEAFGLAESGALAPLLRAAAEGTFQPERELKADHRSEVVQFAFRDRRWVLKRYRTPGLRTRLLHTVRHSPAWREWRAARRLAALGVRGCVPLALIHEPHPLGCTQSLLLPHVVGERLDGVLLRRERSASPVDAAERRRRLHLARAFGHQAGRISRAGLANRDHKPTNLLVDPACRDEGAEPVLIDPVGLRRRWTDKPVWRMLAQLRRTALQAGPVTLREQLACLRAVLRADPSLAAGQPRRLRHAAEAVARARSAAGRSSDAHRSDAP